MTESRIPEKRVGPSFPMREGIIVGIIVVALFATLLASGAHAATGQPQQSSNTNSHYLLLFGSSNVFGFVHVQKTGHKLKVVTTLYKLNQPTSKSVSVTTVVERQVGGGWKRLFRKTQHWNLKSHLRKRVSSGTTSALTLAPDELVRWSVTASYCDTDYGCYQPSGQSGQVKS